MTTLSSVELDSRQNTFQVSLEEFSGPFDLLLSLIAKHKLEVTELALSQVTDDFLSYIKDKGASLPLEEISSFLVVAATLLDLKTARLIPSGEVEDEEDIALLEAADILFARLLQYRAYKQVSGVIKEMMELAPRRWPRTAGFDPGLNQLLPEVKIDISPAQFAAIAVTSLLPRQLADISISHLHSPLVSVKEQTQLIVFKLSRHKNLSFAELVSDCETTGHIVASFLSILELFRQRLITFEQNVPLGPLLIQWQGSDDIEYEIDTEFDDVISDEDETNASS
jgi:segregation and condensation protein A